jgi:dihydrodipicolinate reductase
VRHINKASRAHQANRAKSFLAHPSHGDPRIKVVIRIDAADESALVEVRGVVTTANLRALYVVCRRVTSKVAGYEIIVDLTHARVTKAALDELHEHARQSIVSSGIDASVTSCRLRIIDPPVILKPLGPA